MGGFDAGNYIAKRMRSQSRPNSNSGQRYLYADMDKGGEVLGPLTIAELNQAYVMNRIGKNTYVYPTDGAESSAKLLKAQNDLARDMQRQGADRTSADWVPYAEVATSANPR